MLSFEFFPPKTSQGLIKLKATIDNLSVYKPDFFSITFGASGSNQESTLSTVIELARYTKVPVAPHISCICSSKENICEILSKYAELGITRLVALRGDLPLGQTSCNELPYAADLVRHIRASTGQHFHIDVAAYPEYHPEATNAQQDLEFFKQKIDSGANGAITQYFYNLDAYLRFIEVCKLHKISVPIIPGIMPIFDFQQLEKFSDACGAELPRWLRKQLQSMQTTKQVQEYGIELVTELCQRLVENGAPGLHFYTLNKLEIIESICKNLSSLS